MLLKVNGLPREVPADWHDESMLNVLREPLGLVGTTYGCGVGLCGACTVLIDGQAMRSCLLPVRDIGRAAVTTIDGLSAAGELHPVRQAWLDAAVPQCGCCQAGLSYTLLLAEARCSSASWWLMRTALPIAEVGFISGYADQPHFTRDFRSRVGMTPLRYRTDFGAGE